VESRAWISAAAWAAWLSLSGHSLAQAAPPADPTSTKPPPGEPPSTKPDPAALAFQRSLDAYAANDLPGALEAMQKSYELSGRTELLYNIARIEDELGRCADALAAYGQYLEKVPNGRYRSAAEQARAQLSARCPQPKSVIAEPGGLAPKSAEPPEAPPHPPAASLPATASPDGGWRPPRELAWSALALGAVAGAGAVYFTVAAGNARDRFQADVDRERAGGPFANVDALESDLNHKLTWARALGVTSGVLAAGGIVLLLVSPRTTTQAASSATLYIVPGQVGAGFTQAF
jgi:hypothetical protein